MGGMLAKTNKLWFVVIAGLVLGFFISVAEPDLHILAGQVNSVSSGLISKGSIVVIVSIGIAIMLAVGLGRIVYNITLYKLLTIIYGIIFIPLQMQSEQMRTATQSQDFNTVFLCALFRE